MLSVRWGKVLRDLWMNKTRTVLVVLSIAVGVFAFGMIATCEAVFNREMTVSYLAINPPSFHIYCDLFDDELVNVVERVPGVSQAEGRSSYTLPVAVGDDEWRSLYLTGIADYDDIRMSRITPSAGAWPPPRREILIERASLPALNTAVGEEIVLQGADGKERTLRVAGSAHDINKPPAAFTGGGFGYVTMDTLEWLGYPTLYSELMVKAEETSDIDIIRQVSKRVEAKVEKSGLTVYTTWIPTPGKHPANDSIEPITLVMRFVGMLSLALSGFLVINTISALLAQQRRQIGIMKAVGARAPQVMGLYVGMVALFGVLSLGVALPLGSLAARALTSYMADLVNFDVTDYGAPASVLATEVAVGLVTPLVAALYPVLSGTRTSVRQALSDYAMPKTGARQGFFSRAMTRLRLIPRPLMLSLRNTFRRKGRLVLTLATLTLAGAIFIAVFSVRASLLLTLDDALRYWGEDATIQFARPYRTELLEREARSVPGVVSAETWDFASARWERPDGTQSDAVTIVGAPNPTHMIDPIMVEGRWLLPEDENAIVINSIVLKDDAGIRVGDAITLSINDRESTWRVVGIAKGLATGCTGYVNRDYLGFSQGRVGRASSVRVTTVLHDRETQDRVARALEGHFEGLGVRVHSRSITADTRDTIEYQFNIVIVLLLIMAVLLAVVGGLGLMGTMSINVIERTREVGVMRAIGASDGAVLRIVIAEGMLIGAISWVLGGLLGIPLSQGLSSSLGEALFRSSMSTAFSVGGVLLWLGLVLGLSALASFLPAHNASRLTVREVLAYE